MKTKNKVFYYAVPLGIALIIMAILLTAVSIFVSTEYADYYKFGVFFVLFVVAIWKHHNRSWK